MRQQLYRTKNNQQHQMEKHKLREANEHLTQTYTLYFVEMKNTKGIFLQESRKSTDNDTATNEKV